MPMLVNNEAKPAIIQIRILNPEGDYKWNFGRSWVNRKRLDFLRVVFSWEEGVNLTHPFSPLPFIFLEELICYQ